MELILAAVLLIGGLLSAVAVVIGAPVVMGFVIHDLMSTRSATPKTVKPKDTRMRIAVERGVARAFVIAGGLFWSVAIFAGLRSFQETGVTSALLGALFPLAAVLATLAIGWYYERAAAALLAAASLAVIAWGVIFQFEAGVWAIMVFALIGPMMTASVLFWLARRDQKAFELALATYPELAAAVARSEA
jgi:hypothetical protein